MYVQLKYSSAEEKKFARRNPLKAALNLLTSHVNCLRVEGRWLSILAPE
jgi:hypothetical protein